VVAPRLRNKGVGVVPEVRDEKLQHTSSRGCLTFLTM
jgi:hypothetical protein